MKGIQCYYSKVLIKLLFVLILVFEAIMILCVITNPSNAQLSLVIGVLFAVPILILILGLAVYKISIIDGCMIIRKWYGRSIKTNINQITKIVCNINTNYPDKIMRVTIYKGKKTLIRLDSMLENYDKLVNHLLKHVDESIIENNCFQV